MIYENCSRDVEAGGDLGKSGSGLDQRLYYTTDANMNVTALLDTAGDAVERYLYDPYGKVTVLDADWSVDADGESDYDNAILYCGYFFDSETGLYHVRRHVRGVTTPRRPCRAAATGRPPPPGNSRLPSSRRACTERPAARARGRGPRGPGARGRR